MLQFLIIPMVLGIVTVSAFRANKGLGLLCGIGLFAYVLAQPLGGLVVWMGMAALVLVALKVLGLIFG